MLKNYPEEINNKALTRPGNRPKFFWL